MHIVTNYYIQVQVRVGVPVAASKRAKYDNGQNTRIICVVRDDGLQEILVLRCAGIWMGSGHWHPLSRDETQLTASYSHRLLTVNSQFHLSYPTGPIHMNNIYLCWKDNIFSISFVLERGIFHETE